MRKGFEGIRELADMEYPQHSFNTVGSLLGDLSKLSQGVCIEKTKYGELYVFEETIDSDGKTYVKVAIKKIDNSGIVTFEELTYSYVESHQAWYYNSLDGLEKGLRAARIWEGENDPILGYCLRYVRGCNQPTEKLMPHTLRASVESCKPMRNDSQSDGVPENQKRNTLSSSFIVSIFRKHHFVICIACLLVFGFLFNVSDNSKSNSKIPPKVASSTINKVNAPIEPIAKGNIVTGYDSSKPILNDTGMCELTVDNSRNDMPVYVRVWDMNSYQPVRAFYISQGEEFTAYNLTPSVTSF